MTFHIGGLLCQQVSGFIYELDRRPVCRRGYSVGARTAPRFPKPSHVSTSLMPITKCLMRRLTFVGWYNHYDKPDRFLQRAMLGLIYYQQLFGKIYWLNFPTDLQLHIFCSSWVKCHRHLIKFFKRSWQNCLLFMFREYECITNEKEMETLCSG